MFIELTLHLATGQVVHFYGNFCTTLIEIIPGLYVISGKGHRYYWQKGRMICQNVNWQQRPRKYSDICFSYC